MSEKAPERIWRVPCGWCGEADSSVHGQIAISGDLGGEAYVLASKADECQRKLDIMKKALIEIEMFQGPAAYERLPGMARKALDQCGVNK